MKFVTATVMAAAVLILNQSAQARTYHHPHSLHHQAARHASRHYAVSRHQPGGAWETSGEDRPSATWQSNWPVQPYRTQGPDSYQHYYGHASWIDTRRPLWRPRVRRLTTELGYSEWRRTALAGRHVGGIGLSHRPSAWCGWEMRQLVGSDPGPEFNLARNWARWGRAGPAGVGAVVVWPHHVGKIVGRENGMWVIQSGNDGNRVRTRPRSIAGAIAIRWG